MRETSPAWHLPGTDLHFVTRFDLVSRCCATPRRSRRVRQCTANQPPPHLARASCEAIADQGWPRVSTMLTATRPTTRGTATRWRRPSTPGPSLRSGRHRGDRRRGDRRLHRCRPRRHADGFATPVPVQVIARALNLPGSGASGHQALVGRHHRRDRRRPVRTSAAWRRSGASSSSSGSCATLENVDAARGTTCSDAARSPSSQAPTASPSRPSTTSELLGILQQLSGRATRPPRSCSAR